MRLQVRSVLPGFHKATLNDDLVLPIFEHDSVARPGELRVPIIEELAAAEMEIVFLIDHGYAAGAENITKILAVELDLPSLDGGGIRDDPGVTDETGSLPPFGEDNGCFVAGKGEAVALLGPPVESGYESEGERKKETKRETTAPHRHSPPPLLPRILRCCRSLPQGSHPAR